MPAQPPRSGELPSAALAALSRGRRIEAIRIVRASHGLGLKEARELVEAYEREHPVPRMAGPREESGLRRVVLILAVILALAAIYGWFTGGAPR
ncbi:MAG TPA: ribosomal protein L7/L12 [Pelomicrobium sp.]|nr:ribosomal protein L7/L12 [Pelomicrobium sp.]